MCIVVLMLKYINKNVVMTRNSKTERWYVCKASKS